MKRIKALSNYYDLQLKKDIKAGDEYEVDDMRAVELTTDNNTVHTALAEIVAPTATPEKVAKATPKKKKEAK